MTKQPVQAAGLLLSGLAVGLGLSVSGYFVGDAIRDFKAMDRHVEVKGLAERDVVADQASWVLSYTVSGDEFDAVHAQVDAQGAQLRRFLTEHGIPEADVRPGQTVVTDQSTNPYQPPNPGPRFYVHASVVVESAAVHEVDEAAGAVNELVRAGVLLDPTRPTYRFTKLNDIKPEMLADATRNAREAAERFAESADQRVGDIRSARQGVFSIEATVSSPDAYADASQSLDKRVRVVTSLEFQLE